MKRVFVQSYGCRASQADGAAIEASLENHGYTTVREAAEADLVVLNTCTVTANADVDTRRVDPWSSSRPSWRANPRHRLLCPARSR